MLITDSIYLHLLDDRPDSPFIVMGDVHDQLTDGGGAPHSLPFRQLCDVTSLLDTKAERNSDQKWCQKE